MIRVALTADNQYDARSRLDEARRVDRFMALDAEARGVDLWLHGGDVFERRSTAEEREAAAEFFCSLSAHCVVVKGNHEADGEVAELNRLDAPHEILAFEQPGVEYVGGCAVCCLPWPSMARLHSWLIQPTGPEEASRTAVELLRDILRGFREELSGFLGPRILLAHVQLSGVRTCPDQPPLTGLPLELSLEDLALAGADVVCLGHIHLPQDFTIDGVPVIYPGSPRRTAYAKGELVEKGYVVLEFGERDEAGRMPVQWARVPTPATQMHLVEMRWLDDGLVADEFTVPDRGSEIRLRYAVDVEHRETARAQAQELAADWTARGAIDVKVEEVVRPTTTARLPEIVESRDVAGKVRRYLDHKQIALGEREGAVLAKLDQVEQEVRRG